MISASPDGTILKIYVQPKAARTEYVGLHGDALKFRVAAPPVDGAANEALCLYLAERFDLPKGAVRILAGQSSRHKQVLLKGVTRDRVASDLGCPL
jgi:uncharacterized protein (TIGR00251 family)